ARLGGPSALERLQALLASDDPSDRRAALQGLGRVGGTRAAGMVALALADEDADVPAVAAQVLGRIRDGAGERRGCITSCGPCAPAAAMCGPTPPARSARRARSRRSGRCATACATTTREWPWRRSKRWA